MWLAPGIRDWKMAKSMPGRYGIWESGWWWRKHWRVVMKETLTGQAAGSPALPEGICTRTKLQRLSNWRDSVAWRQLFIPKRNRKFFLLLMTRGKELFLFLHYKLYSCSKQIDIVLILWLHFLYCVGGGARPPPGLVFTVVTHKTQHIVMLRAEIYYCGRMQSLYKSAKKKALGARSRGNQVQTFKCPFLMNSPRVHLNPAAVMCYYWGTGQVVSKFFWGHMVGDWSCWLAYTKIPTSRRKLGIQHKSQCAV